jgi:polyisoprenoid-binding protein YceI
LCGRRHQPGGGEGEEGAAGEGWEHCDEPPARRWGNYVTILRAHTASMREDMRMSMLQLGFVVALSVLNSGVLSAEALRLELDKQKTYIAAMVDKQGFLTVFGAGHKHGLLATEWSAEVCLDKEQPANSRAHFTIPAGSIVIDTPEARRRAGLEPDGPGESDVREIQAKMLGVDVLAAERFKEISFRTSELAAMRDGRWDWRGSIMIRGVTKPISVPISVESSDGNQYRMSGSFKVKQSEFGITPISIAGVVKVKDEIEIRFELFGSLISQACPSTP